MKTLDKNKPFGTVHGGGTDAAFEQDGILFDTEGNELGGSAASPSPKAKTKKDPTAILQADSTADAELEAQLAANLQG